MFEAVLDAGCIYFNDDLFDQFLNLLNVDYDHSYRISLIRSDYFKLWFSKRILMHNTITDLEDLLHSLGMDAEDSLTLVIDENG